MSTSHVKKHGGLALLAISLVFLSFTVGFFLGRNTHSGGVEIQKGTLSAPVSDDTAVTEETAQTEETTQTEQQYPVNINTAALDQLTLLPGIGPVLGQRIIDYRTTHGDFTSLNELLNIEGIGEKRLEQLLPYATLGG